MGECKKFDGIKLMILVVIIFLFGLLFLYSASVFYNYRGSMDNYFTIMWSTYAIKQFLFGIVGISLMILMYRIGVEPLYKYAYHLILAGLFLMILVFVPHVGFSAGGATRWIRLGPVSFQPSEFLKLALITYLARSLSGKKKVIKDFWMGFFPYMVILGVVAVLLLLQEDIGDFVIISYLTFLLLLISGAEILYIALMSLLGVSIVTTAILFTHRIDRVKAWLNPWDYASNYGYQIIQSLVALSNGGVTGRSPGAGLQQLSFLPEAHTDYIFAIIGEEGGFIVTTLFIVAFVYLLYLSFKIALAQKNSFNMILAIGIASLLGIEIIINLAVVTNIFPTKGLPLPFVSYGGSNLLVSFTMIGILASLGRKCEEM